MPKIKYRDINMSPARLLVVDQANAIIDSYEAQGFDLTLRQLYYRFVASGLIPNRDTEYKRLGDIINDARLAGLVDWSRITDRTRFVRTHASWGSPGSIIQSAASGYALDRWAGQPKRIEVWIEKDALVGVIEPICTELRVPYFSCRGYTSQSEMWGAAQRLLRYRRAGQAPIILHLGDHDPSGIDMSRDIRDRLAMFMGGVAPEFERLALNMDQVEQYQPPPNPAKLTDSRVGPYLAEYGDESWELDALEPVTLAALIREAVEVHLDDPTWEAVEARENRERVMLQSVATRWAEAVTALGLDSTPAAPPESAEDDDECLRCKDWRGNHDGPGGRCEMRDADGDPCGCDEFVEPDGEASCAECGDMKMEHENGRGECSICDCTEFVPEEDEG